MQVLALRSELESKARALQGLQADMKALQASWGSVQRRRWGIVARGLSRPVLGGACGSDLSVARTLMTFRSTC